ncbi:MULTISPECIES: UDP-N-acetylmuramoyl-L-alanyl-D-glutamate--2,6-diaminopimelate ligase [unclassified Sporosarcina]|uniref:UDP-N-acetylmuramoyl-L-alanyl-D-glutamate--2, 6-diaminopimelate ligase n=1 Tax=unclassified Sporosarcina TaxID=2647733 RepID=UPI0020421863|nr:MULTISPECIES: UDP-N-acetylmuramoyl-L-alanyl-D-glutamate--2,6-diaminopimelate ligase [unclassified Sporosarcina]GKV64305.1 UDP-N-acetylmuramoyl-L-alanyl-D-glutamate--2,6-diaminopimelate ligase 2 [Sporosarcina sp. NCCP-2331]GLB54231.1 UDP-N-acetylmuramoyl-L-alanyl-D-glutamate--2,6-diaminopimelate ligase 2 [Sporosarcina sp. NCCP-2378]
MLLSELIKEWPCTLLQGSIRQTVGGITENSKRVQKDFVFVARKGALCDGLEFIEEAIVKGATTIVLDRVNADLHIPAGVTVVVVPDSSLFISFASAKLAGNPASELTVIAVTGTNGKTTVSHFIGQLLAAQGVKAAVIGTTGIYIDGILNGTPDDSLTTMPAEQLHPLLRTCIEQQVTHVILEASSIGLSSNRLAHCSITIGILLNIGIDHYAEHGGKQAYIDAKKRLVSLAERLVVNESDPVCAEMSREAAGTVLYFNETHINSTLTTINGFKVNVPGLHNEMNARAAVCAMQAADFSYEDAVLNLAVLKLPEGRLEKYSQRGVDVFVDYAHTPDALRAVLETLSEDGARRVVTVFGCGGDRDHEKRPQMGAVAAQHSAHVILTSDNPRSEEPSSIITDILAGTTGFTVPVDVLLDRKLAIRYAIRQAGQGDIVLIAGKGHEKTQQIGSRIESFCDMNEVQSAFAEEDKVNLES